MSRWLSHLDSESRVRWFDSSRGSMDIWKGSFAPVTKHGLYTGDVRNHLYISSIEPVDAEADLSDRYDLEIDPEEIEELGEGSYTFMVTMSWVNGGVAYHFLVSSDDAIMETETAKTLITDYYRSK